MRTPRRTGSRRRPRVIPTTHYGVYKQANEGTARVYALDDGIASIGLRPMTVYGAGRDQGLTSSPTTAIAAAVLGVPYTIAFGGRTLFQYAEDVARTLLAASRSGLDGAHVFNLGGSSVDMPAWIAAIERSVPEAAGRITFEAKELPFPSEIEHASLAALGPLPVTALRGRDPGHRRHLPPARRRGPPRRNGAGPGRRRGPAALSGARRGRSLRPCLGT